MQGKFFIKKFVDLFILSTFVRSQYDPTEPGDYRVEVKWANELVPGSPFPVMIFDTQEELRRFIAINS